jgi:hypothetical protein
VSAPGDYDNGEIGGMIGRGNRSIQRKPAPVPLCTGTHLAERHPENEEEEDSFSGKIIFLPTLFPKFWRDQELLLHF